MSSCTQGVIYVHSAPAALCPHVVWALESVLGARVPVEWRRQPLSRGLQRGEAGWRGPAGTGARLASALRGWADLRYEVTEEPSPGCDGGRWSYTPRLGIRHTPTAANGDAVVTEDRLRAVLAEVVDAPSARQAARELLGSAWDEELEPYRCATDDGTLRLLHKVG